MKHTDPTKAGQIALHPELFHTLLAKPNQESLRTIIEFQLLDQPAQPFLENLQYHLPVWEQQACDGNSTLAPLIEYIVRSASHLIQQEPLIQANLLRIRILSSTPGNFSFPADEVREHLIDFLRTADVLADLPTFEVLSFNQTEIDPLASDFIRFKLTPHSRRYIQNLFYPERREAVLSVLAYIAKLYPLIAISRQAYALMLSLDDPALWSRHPFCLRLIANRFWEYKLRKSSDPSF